MSSLRSEWRGQVHKNGGQFVECGEVVKECTQLAWHYLRSWVISLELVYIKNIGQGRVRS